jgi:hypothetical protein
MAQAGVSKPSPSNKAHADRVTFHGRLRLRFQRLMTRILNLRAGSAQGFRSGEPGGLDPAGSHKLTIHYHKYR